MTTSVSAGKRKEVPLEVPPGALGAVQLRGRSCRAAARRLPSASEEQQRNTFKEAARTVSVGFATWHGP